MRVSKEGLTSAVAVLAAVFGSYALAGCTAQEEAPTPTAQETTYDTESGLAPEVQAMLYDHLNTSLQIMRDDISDAESLAFAIVGTNFYKEHIVNVTNPDIVNNPNSLTISVNDGAERLKTPVEIALTRMTDSEKSESNRYTDIYNHLLANSNNPHDALFLTANELEDVLGQWFVSNGFKANEIEFADIPIEDLEQILQGETPSSMVTSSRDLEANNVLVDEKEIVLIDDVILGIKQMFEEHGYNFDDLEFSDSQTSILVGKFLRNRTDLDALIDQYGDCLPQILNDPDSVMPLPNSPNGKDGEYINLQFDPNNPPENCELLSLR